MGTPNDDISATSYIKTTDEVVSASVEEAVEEVATEETASAEESIA